MRAQARLNGGFLGDCLTERPALVQGKVSRALDRVAAEVERIPAEQAAAREAIWTPDKEKPKTETKLWTPGS